MDQIPLDSQTLMSVTDENFQFASDPSTLPLKSKVEEHIRRNPGDRDSFAWYLNGQVPPDIATTRLFCEALGIKGRFFLGNLGTRCFVDRMPNKTKWQEGLVLQQCECLVENYGVDQSQKIDDSGSPDVVFGMIEASGKVNPCSAQLRLRNGQFWFISNPNTTYAAKYDVKVLPNAQAVAIPLHQIAWVVHATTFADFCAVHAIMKMREAQDQLQRARAIDADSNASDDIEFFKRELDNAERTIHNLEDQLQQINRDGNAPTPSGPRVAFAAGPVRPANSESASPADLFQEIDIGHVPVVVSHKNLRYLLAHPDVKLNLASKVINRTNALAIKNGVSTSWLATWQKAYAAWVDAAHILAPNVSPNVWDYSAMRKLGDHLSLALLAVASKKDLAEYEKAFAKGMPSDSALYSKEVAETSSALATVLNGGDKDSINRSANRSSRGRSRRRGGAKRSGSASSSGNADQGQKASKRRN